jgi:hypothetical protein
MLYESLKDYFVNDLVYTDTQVIFVLESPHTEEVKNGYPVAGKSGKDMSKVLFDYDEAFGKLVYEQSIKNIGIVNVCNFPLQKSAYKNIDSKELDFFEKIRQNPKARKNDTIGINEILGVMMSDFAVRLNKHKDKKIVLCGNFAQKCFENHLNADDFQAILHVPHPSFNNWKKEKYADAIQALKIFVK